LNSNLRNKFRSMKNFSMKKLYYSISEVSRITDLEQYVLRYWETEFDQLQPAKNSSGNRIYTNKDIKLILLIKKLLKEEKYTIEGAKKILKSFAVSNEEGKDAADMKMVEMEKARGGELSLFENASNDLSEAGDSKVVEDLKEIRIFLEELYNQLDD